VCVLKGEDEVVQQDEQHELDDGQLEVGRPVVARRRRAGRPAVQLELGGRQGKGGDEEEGDQEDGVCYCFYFLGLLITTMGFATGKVISTSIIF